MRLATRAIPGLLTIAALLVPALGAADWDPLFRTHLSLPQGTSAFFPARAATPTDAATGDLDGDGLPDIAVTSTSTMFSSGTTIAVLLHSRREDSPPLYQTWRTFTVTDPSATPREIGIADLNGDGKMDVLTYNTVSLSLSPHSISILYGQGGGYFRPVRTKFPPDYQGGFALADLNNDGRTDVACRVGTGGGNFGVAVMYSTPDSLGSPVVYGSSAGLNGFGIGDATSDGIPDLILTYANAMQILVGNNAGNFNASVPPIPFGSPGGATLVNVNGDGILDMVQFNPDGFEAVILMGSGIGTFQSPVTVPLGPVEDGQLDLLTGDVDGDGDIDLVGYSRISAGMYVLRNGGAGTFGPATHYAGRFNSGAPAPLVDVNEDGRPDVVVGDVHGLATNAVGVFLNDGTGGFQADVKAIDAVKPRHEALGDFNRDGKIDIAVGDSLRITVGLGNGDGTFTPAGVMPTVLDPGTIVTADINRDGKRDLLVQIGADIYIYLGAGDATFAQSQTLTGATLLQRSVADLNRDGRPDLIAGSGSQFRTYAQQTDGSYNAFTTYSPAVGFRSFAVGDWNRDGAMDVAVAGTNGLSVYAGSTLTPGVLGAEAVLASGTQYVDVCVGDFNRDGAPDLAGRLSTGVFVGINVFTGNGSGGFGAPAPYVVTTATGQSIDSWDANRDGLPDLITTGRGLDNEGSAHAEVLLGGPSGTFGMRSGYGLGAPTWDKVSFGDLNGDAMPDIVSASPALDTPAHPDRTIERTVLANPPQRGTGLMNPLLVSTLDFPTGVAVGDLNRDGKPDVVTSTSAAAPSVAVLLGSGDGALGPSTTVPQSWAALRVALADLNRDGILDIAASNNNLTPRVSTMLGLGDGTFGARSDFFMFAGLDFEIGDLNRDGIPDIVTSLHGVAGQDSVSVLLGNGSGGLTPSATAVIGSPTYDVDLADLNRDGYTDVVVAAGTIKVIYGGAGATLGAPVTLAAPLTACETLSVADFNRDGLLDIAAGNSTTHYIVWGNATTPFATWASTILPLVAYDMEVGEAAADGVPYVYVTTNFGQIKILSVSQAGVLAEVASAAATTSPYGLALADINRDGALDAATVGQGGALLSVNLHGTLLVTAVEAPTPAPTSPRVSLHQNYPNPFNPRTTIHYTLPRAERVRLRVFDVKGRLVTTLRDGLEPAGERRVEWDGRDRSGQPVASGVYLYRLTTDSGDLRSRRMVVVK